MISGVGQGLQEHCSLNLTGMTSCVECACCFSIFPRGRVCAGAAANLCMAVCPLEPACWCCSRVLLRDVYVYSSAALWSCRVQLADVHGCVCFEARVLLPQGAVHKYLCSLGSMPMQPLFCGCAIVVCKFFSCHTKEDACFLLAIPGK